MIITCKFKQYKDAMFIYTTNVYYDKNFYSDIEIFEFVGINWWINIAMYSKKSCVYIFQRWHHDT